MEAIIFTGIQASGKSSFYKNRFFDTHVRISMDLLNTRNKEKQFIEKCIELHQRVVIDNTNPTKASRRKYIQEFQDAHYKVIGYYFQSKVDICLDRNAQRIGKAKIPEVGILSTFKQLELPQLKEGFDELYYVEIDREKFVIKKWENEI